MTALTLFGLALSPLYAAIAKVESDNGLTSMNVYQIDAHGGSIYTDDVNRILIERYKRLSPSESRIWRAPPHHFAHADTLNRAQSEYMMAIYWSHWGEHYEKKTGKPVTYEVLARIHNGGPLGWKKSATLAYWTKVKAVMEGGAK